MNSYYKVYKRHSPLKFVNYKNLHFDFRFRTRPFRPFRPFVPFKILCCGVAQTMNVEENETINLFLGSLEEIRGSII